MPLKKYVNGSWVDSSYRRYETGTDTVTNLPVEILTDGQPVTSWSMKGNTQTSGTPSPSNPVTISGVGEETANLFSSPWEQGSINATTGANVSASSEVRTTDYIAVEYNKIYSISRDITSGQIKLRFYASDSSYVGSGSNNIEVIWGRSATNPMYTNDTFCCIKIINSNIAYMRMIDGANNIATKYMMVEGEYTAETMPSYEPYGKFKISILKDLSPLTPVYLSEPLLLFNNTVDTLDSNGTVTYAFRKKILDGTEQWTEYQTTSRFFYITLWPTAGITSRTLNTHFPTNKFQVVTGSILRFYDDTVVYQSVDDFKTFLAQQYAAGTPVTLYYILATPTTETVTVPTITTTGGTVTIDVDTTVKPSEMDITYHGWHEHQPLKRENGSWS